MSRYTLILRSIAAVLLLVAVTVFGCATGNPTDIFSAGTGGYAGTGTSSTGGHAAGGGPSTTQTSTTSTSTSTSTGGGQGGTGGGIGGAGGSIACIHQADCAALMNSCNAANCVNNVCMQVPAADGTPCDDGLFCDTDDTCTFGTCSGIPMSCPSANPCQVGTCDEATKSCTTAPGNDGAQCTTTDLCAPDGTCLGGTCSNGIPVDCSGLDGTCTVGMCETQSGNCMAVAANDGTTCDDGLFCTDNDVCTAGTCMGTPLVCPPGPSPCMVGQCSEANQACETVAGNNGAACTGTNTCVTGTTCVNGTCAGGTPANNGATCTPGAVCTMADTCQSGVCTGPAITQCVGGDGCCPPGCTGANDPDCLYFPTGPQQNIPVSMLTGWTLCYQDTYDVNLANVIGTVQSECNQTNLLMACSPVGASTFTVLAAGLRTDVFFDTGSPNPGEDTTHTANGVEWYFSTTWSWGFAAVGDAVLLDECDEDGQGGFGGSDDGGRLCWHTVSNAGGYRCGATTGLNASTQWSRYVYQAN